MYYRFFYAFYMLTIPFIRENRDTVLQGLKIKNFHSPELIDQIIELDNTRRSLQVKTNELQAQMNSLSKEIGQLFKSGEREKANQVKEQTTGIKGELETLEQDLQGANEQMKELLVQVPNVPHPSVPGGNSEADNIEIRSGGTIPSLHEGALPHWELGKKYKLIDFDLGVKITAADFQYIGAWEQGCRGHSLPISWIKI